MNNINEDVKIKVILKDKGKLLANANVAIETVKFGFVTIKGFQIWKSPRFNERLQEAINITPPTKPAYGHFITQLFFEDMNKWFELEEKIYGVYLSTRNDVSNVASLGKEDINPNEIPV